MKELEKERDMMTSIAEKIRIRELEQLGQIAALTKERDEANRKTDKFSEAWNISDEILSKFKSERDALASQVEGRDETIADLRESVATWRAERNALLADKERLTTALNDMLTTSNWPKACEHARAALLPHRQ